MRFVGLLVIALALAGCQLDLEQFTGPMATVAPVNQSSPDQGTSPETSAGTDHPSDYAQEDTGVYYYCYDEQGNITPMDRPGQCPEATSVAPVPPPAPSSQSHTGLLAKLTGLSADPGSSELTEMVTQTFPGRIPQSIDFLILLTPTDEAFLVVAIDTKMDGLVTAGKVEGAYFPVPQALQQQLSFLKGAIVSDRVTLMKSIPTSPEQVNRDPSSYRFKRVTMDTTYLFASTRIKNAPAGFQRLGFGLVTDHLGDRSPEAYLTVLDPHNTEAQIRPARITGTVLYPTTGMMGLLKEAYQFSPEDLAQVQQGPTLFYESIEVKQPQMVAIGDLMPRLADYHGQIVRIRGVAGGQQVKTEDIPQLSNLPLHFTFKAIGVTDSTGAMPIVGISSEDVQGAVLGSFQMDLSIYQFDNGAAVAFLLRKEPISLEEVQVPEPPSGKPGVPVPRGIP